MCANWGPSPHPSSPTWLWWIELRVSASWPSFGVPWSTSLHQSPNPCCLPTTENCSRHTLNVIINNKTHPKEKSNGKSKFLLRFESTRPQTPSSSSSGHLWGDASWGLPSKRSGAWLINFFLRYIQYEKMKHKKKMKCACWGFEKWSSSSPSTSTQPWCGGKCKKLWTSIASQNQLPALLALESISSCAHSSCI